MRLLFLALSWAVLQITVAENECPAKWMTFDRPQGRWCVRVFFGVYTRDVSQVQCAKHHAVLTGIQTDEERLQIADAGRAEFISANPNAHELGDAAIWLGAQRKPACTRNGLCAAKDVFTWTDGFTNGTAGFSFAPGEPEIAWAPAWGGLESCLQQFVFYSGRTHPRWPGFPHGSLADNWCTQTVKPLSRLFACGKRPE